MSDTYRGRVRFGCLACRASKVKCEEQYPICRRCQRRDKQCVYTKRRAPRLPPADGLHRGGFDEQNRLLRHGRGATIEKQSNLLSTLIAENIYICSTIDLLSAYNQQASAAHFHTEVDIFFITPFDPVNWANFKDRLLDLSSHSPPVAAATEALLVLHRARKNSLSHAKALAARDIAYRSFERTSCGRPAMNVFDSLFTVAFLLALFEMLLPQETSPSPLARANGSFVAILELWASDHHAQSALSLRLGAWVLVAHAAARRAGGRGLLSAPIQHVLLAVCAPGKLKPILPADHASSMAHSLPVHAFEPLFGFHYRLQLLSGRVAELSHYHRQRTTGADQEEVSELMATLRSEMELLWQNRPMLMYLPQSDVRSPIPFAGVSEPLSLSATLCALIYHTELIELGRNLSAEQVPSVEAKTHLAAVRETVPNLDDSDLIHNAAMLRPLFMYAIESSVEADWLWAINRIRRIKDPLCYSEFFANFAAGLCEMQGKRGRRVTTRWWCLQAFGIEPPYL